MSKKVCIIGNGFDLDLGMNTRYSDFANSENWPQDSVSNGCLSQYLRDKRTINKWFDLEKELLLYARDAEKRIQTKLIYKKFKEKNRIFYDNLVRGLTDYLRKEEEKEIKNDSVAAKVLKAVVENGYFSSIYSFNYTNLHKIARKIGIYSQFRYEHVHGSIEENSIILGVEEKSDLIPGYQFLYKTYNPHYESHAIQYDMLEADEVVFFGHSLGDNDYHYFQMFFRNQCRDNMTRKEGKRITIFTFNEDSRIEILEQLRRMNDKKTDLLFNQNQMQIICTKDGGGSRLTTFLKNLEENCVHAHKAVLSAFL